MNLETLLNHQINICHSGNITSSPIQDFQSLKNIKTTFTIDGDVTGKLDCIFSLDQVHENFNLNTTIPFFIESSNLISYFLIKELKTIYFKNQNIQLNGPKLDQNSNYYTINMYNYYKINQVNYQNHEFKTLIGINTDRRLND